MRFPPFLLWKTKEIILVFPTILTHKHLLSVFCLYVNVSPPKTHFWKICYLCGSCESNHLLSKQGKFGLVTTIIRL